LLLGGVALSVATVQAVGGVSAVVESSKTWELLLPASDPDFPWTMYLGGTLCISTFYCAANQFIVQRALAAKDEWHARMGIVFTDYLKFLMPLIIIVPGMMAPKLLPDLARADLVFPTLVETLLPAGLVGLVMAGLIAAVMGHTSGAINSVSTIATMDFYVPWTRWRAARRSAALVPASPSGGSAGSSPAEAEEATDQQAVRFGRWFGVFSIVIGVACAEMLTQHAKKPIFLYLLNAYGYFTPGIATMFLLGILWKRTTSAGALAAGLLTIPLSLGLQWTFPSLAFQNRTGIVFWSCILICVVVSLCTRPKSAEELKGLIWTRESLRLPPEQRHKYRGVRRPGLWWAIVTAMVLFFYIRFA
jgi:SSS family solute:Na+ symporter